ncbi:MAG: hypothetical protein J3K34DRAFT_404010 [Monoraphidium minutum]|nr:MAG: hypothetical protein J3K34DRAFT_404010 [Monoraphidium minutum]
MARPRRARGPGASALAATVLLALAAAALPRAAAQPCYVSDADPSVCYAPFVRASMGRVSFRGQGAKLRPAASSPPPPACGAPHCRAPSPPPRSISYPRPRARPRRPPANPVGWPPTSIRVQGFNPEPLSTHLTPDPRPSACPPQLRPLCSNPSAPM